MEIAESFNKYFANIGKTTSKMFKRGNDSYTNYLDKLVINSMFMEEVDYLYMMDIVKTLKLKVSSGFDKISSKLIKETISNIIHPLTHITNRSLNTGIVHDQLKLAMTLFLPLSFRCRSTTKITTY